MGSKILQGNSGGMISINLGIRHARIENMGHYWQRRCNFHKEGEKERDRETDIRGGG